MQLDYLSPMLDSTNPGVLKFLAWEFTRLDDLGFDYYKFDGEFSLPSTHLGWIRAVCTRHRPTSSRTTVKGWR